MSFRFKLNDKVAERLCKNPDEKFTPRQIVEWVIEKYPDEVKKKAEESGNQELLRLWIIILQMMK